MTTSAHNVKRVWGGATRTPIEGRGSARTMYRELHPEMHKDIPSSKPVKADKPAKAENPKQGKPQKRHEPKPDQPRLTGARIVEYLRDGDATIRQIANDLGYCVETVRSHLWRGVEGVGAKGVTDPEKGIRSKLWGLTDEITAS